MASQRKFLLAVFGIVYEYHSEIEWDSISNMRYGMHAEPCHTWCVRAAPMADAACKLYEIEFFIRV